MRVQLIIPPFPRQERMGKTKALYPVYPQLGLAYIAAIAESLGHQVEIIDAEALLLSREDVLEAIDDFRPQILGFQAFTHSQDNCHTVARLAKERLPNVTVVFGGIACTAQPEYQMTPGKVCDYAVRGEGEHCFTELLALIQQKLPPEQHDVEAAAIESLIWKNRHGEIKINRRRKEVPSMDDLPNPALHLLPMGLYSAPAHLRGDAIHEMMLTRGCPFNCSFCMSPISFKTRFRSFSVERSLRDIRMMQNTYGMDSIQFYDDVFTYDRENCMELLDAMIEENLGIPWTCLTRVDLVDQELLDKMNRAGCYQVFFGMESATPRILKLVHKGTDLDQVRSAVKMVRKAGIESFLSVMIGFPTETQEEAYDTMQFVRAVDPDYALWHRFTPWPGSQIYELALEHGKLRTDDLSKYTINWGFVYQPDGWTHAELERAELIAMRRFYMRPKKFLQRLKVLFKLPRKRAWNLLKHAPDLLLPNPNVPKGAAS